MEIENVTSTTFDGYIMQRGTINGYHGFRPVVCLKTEVELKKQSDGIYEIIRRV